MGHAREISGLPLATPRSRARAGGGHPSSRRIVCSVFFVVSQKTAPPRAVTVAPGRSLAWQFFRQIRRLSYVRVSRNRESRSNHDE